MTRSLHGTCLCGAVAVRVTQWTHEISACHCSLCRTWAGGVQFGFDAPRDAVTVTGDVRRYRATGFSERAFCPVCGTALWLMDDEGPYEFVPGLFEGARDMPLVREVYADRAWACARLSGDHPRIGRAEYEAKNPHVEGDA